ncbi:MAG TPA: hypothetical protein VGY56_00575, partial [Verrucomicrobiae bacterium]|nr:hypothetical protein [Verrucomicrobiae bacterium]
MISPHPASFSNFAHRPTVNSVVRLPQILSILLVFGLCAPVKAQLTVSNLTSLSESVVQAAINAASPGEEVKLPAGTTIWTSPLIINNNISLAGAGSAKTIIINDIPTTAYEAQNGGLIQWNTVSNYTQCELSGFEFEDEQTYADYDSEIQFHGWCPVCHVTDCVFWNLSDVGVLFDEGAYGCLDHDQFATTNFANQILCYNGALGGYTPQDGENEYGDVSYATPVTYGTTNWWIYIEDCGFSYNGPNYWSAVNDARAGTRVVFRYNSITNMIFQFHGTESSGRIRGGRACEIYDNFFINNAAGYPNQGTA